MDQEVESLMNGHSITIIRFLIKSVKSVIVSVGILCAVSLVLCCADMREEFDSSKWRYQPFPDAPPSWENDYGRPDMNGGEPPFS
jgi:hypothetical protein